jgi:S1-C subfamily serine protease
MTVKACPRCQKQNRIAAKFCTGCGYIFAAPAPPLVPRRALYAAAAGVLVLALLLAGLLSVARGRPRTAAGPAAATPSAAPTGVSPATAVSRTLLATVQIIVPVDRERRSSAGSGTVLTPQGHILTNFHVIGDPRTGRLYNRAGTIYIAVNPADVREPPEVRYVARLAQSDLDHDLALLVIEAARDGGRLPADLGLTTLPVGDSDTVKIGDELAIVGFPGLGGATVTLTKGTVAGFLTAEGWIKTDAEINSGNSGGAAVNGAGQLVGIPSAAATGTAHVPGKIGLVRPVNLARPLVDVAMRDGGED